MRRRRRRLRRRGCQGRLAEWLGRLRRSVPRSCRSPGSPTSTRRNLQRSSPERREASWLRRDEMPVCSDNIRFFAGGLHPRGRSAGEYMRGYTSSSAARRSGSSAASSPELPARDGRLKLAPALAAGNTQVLKPSEQTPLSPSVSSGSPTTSFHRACSTSSPETASRRGGDRHTRTYASVAHRRRRDGEDHRAHGRRHLKRVHLSSAARRPSWSRRRRSGRRRRGHQDRRY